MRSLWWLLAALLTALIVGAPASSADAAEAPVEPQIVYVGFYGETISEVDQFNNQFWIDFYFWMRWDQGPKPLPNLEFTNNVETWSIMTRRLYETPVEQPDGSKLQVLRVQGKFAHPFDFTDYPLDQHTLTVRIEDALANSKRLVYSADPEGIGLDETFQLPGWRISDPRVDISTHTYETTFGETSMAPTETYSVASFAVDIERPRSFFLWKLLLPLIIVLALGLSVMFIHPSLTEVRLGAPATALLTLVFLQASYSAQLPEVGKLVLLDQVYVLAYLVILSVLLVTIVTSYWVRSSDEADVRRAYRLDHRVAALSMSGFVVGSLLLVLAAH